MTRQPGWTAPVRRWLRQWIDPFVIAILVTLVVGILVPLPAQVRGVLDGGADVAVALLFLLYGARLPTHEIARSLRNWRLQGGLLVATFVIFPLIGLAVSVLAGPVVGTGIAAGLLCLSLLPSTVNSSVAFTALARGDVSGAICGATVSNVLGLVLTPLLVLGLMSGSTGVFQADGVAAGTGGLQTVLLQLLLPFVLGQLLQPWIGERVRRTPWLTQTVDRGTILLIVLTAVSGATAEGVWDGMTVWTVVALIGSAGILLGVMLAVTWWGGRAIGLPRDQNVTLLLCGSMKSLATGLPMAAALLPAAVLGVIAVPIVVFHQLQLVVCSVIARRLGARADADVA